MGDVGGVGSLLNGQNLLSVKGKDCSNNIVTDKGLNLFDDCAAECVLCIRALRKKSTPLLPGGTVKYTLLAPKQIYRQTGH